ncbi:MAG: hypothetical protein ABI208_01035 [Ginsengibacter sp.]
MKENRYHTIFFTRIFWAFALLFSISANAQSPVIKTSVDKNSILIGQPLNYRIDVLIPDNSYHFNWASLPDSIPHFEIISRGKLDSSIKDGFVQFTQNIVLTSFDSGRMVIPSVGFKFESSEDDSALQLFSDSLAINVAYSPLDSIQPFHDIKGIILVKADKPWWIWVLLSAGLILFILLIWWLIKVFRKKEVATQLFSSKIPPFDEAMKALAQLKEEPIQSPPQIKEYHTQLTDIFKRYLSRKTNHNKLQLTSDEIFMDLKSMGFSNDSIGDFANSIRMANAVKFAKFLPSLTENKNCWEQTKSMITAIHHLTFKNEQNGI